MTDTLSRPSRDLNRRIKRWPAWVAMVFVVAGALTIGITSASGPQTPEDRVDAITKRVACPICDGESVFDSQNNASVAIRSQVGELVAENQLDDDEIVAFIETRYGAQVLLVPRASGFDALVWVLPAVAFMCGTVGLALAFRRWKAESDASLDPTEADRALVDKALREQHEADRRGDLPDESSDGS